MSGESGVSGESGALGYRLRVEWLLALGAATAVVWAGGLLVSGLVTPGAGLRWLLVGGAVIAYEVGFLSYHLDRGRADGPSPGRSLGSANAITLVRGALFAVVAGFLTVPPATPVVRWAPALCYGAGAALDAVDGAVARRRGLETELGARLDMAFDTLGFLVAPLVGVAWGRLPIWYLALSAARYLFRGGTAWRSFRGRPVHPLPESRLRRRLAAFQMAFIAVALAPVLPTAVTYPAAAVTIAPSLAVFVRDWLVVSGRRSA